MCFAVYWIDVLFVIGFGVCLFVGERCVWWVGFWWLVWVVGFTWWLGWLIALASLCVGFVCVFARLRLFRF